MKYATGYPLIFDIARGSFEDGPGIRTVIFFKGCPLQCSWCHNPESQSPDPELFFDPDYCIQCGNCNTGCNTLARRSIGKYYAPEELAGIIVRDKVFYETSGGGVTFSGGEPLLFIDYLRQVAEIIKQETISIAIETCGYFDFHEFDTKLMPLVDLIFYDLKLMNREMHCQYTGKSNELIIANFKKLLNCKQNLIPRTPLVPGITDTDENLAQLAGLMAELQINNHCFLPFNSAGTEKKRRLKPIEPGNAC